MGLYGGKCWGWAAAGEPSSSTPQLRLIFHPYLYLFRLQTTQIHPNSNTFCPSLRNNAPFFQDGRRFGHVQPKTNDGMAYRACWDGFWDGLLGNLCPANRDLCFSVNGLCLIFDPFLTDIAWKRTHFLWLITTATSSRSTQPSSTALSDQLTAVRGAISKPTVLGVQKWNIQTINWERILLFKSGKCYL